MMIGISSKYETTSKEFCDALDYAQYAYYTYSGEVEYRSNYKRYGRELNQGDTICMELNLYEQTLKYDVNGEDFGTAFENIETGEDIHYRFALSICVQGVVEIIDFQRYKIEN